MMDRHWITLLCVIVFACSFNALAYKDNGEHIARNKLRETSINQESVSADRVKRSVKYKNNRELVTGVKLGILSNEQESYNAFGSHRAKRKVIQFDNHIGQKWPLNIKYFIEANFTDQQKDTIRSVLREDFEAVTCLNFEELASPPDPDTEHEQYIRFRGNPNTWGCLSYIGRREDTVTFSGQNVLLGEHCFIMRGNLMFSIASTLGLHAEMNRPDRDDYVTVFSENILHEDRTYFTKLSENRATTHSIPYDYGSVMQQGSRASLREDLMLDITAFTILPHDVRHLRTMGQKSQISFYDVMALNVAYCEGACDAEPRLSCENRGYQAPPDCSICRCPDGFSGPLCNEIATGTDDCMPSSGEIRVSDDTVRCIASPKFHQHSYLYGDSCTWVLQAPPGKYIEVFFAQKLWLPGLGDSPFAACDHWVEIKHEGKTQVRGPRFCYPAQTDDGLLKQSNPPTEDNSILSDSNELMVLFRAPDFRASQNPEHMNLYVNDSFGFSLCYRMSHVGPLTPTPEPPFTLSSGPLEPKTKPTPTKRPLTGITATTTEHTVSPGAQRSKTKEDNDSTLLLVGIIVGALLLVLAVLVILLICCLWRRTKRQPPAPQHNQPPVSVAYINQGYSTTTHATAGVEIDFVKKDPDDLDFSHVGELPGSDPYDNVPSPPAYEDVPIHDSDPNEDMSMETYSSAALTKE